VHSDLDESWHTCEWEEEAACQLRENTFYIYSTYITYEKSDWDTGYRDSASDYLIQITCDTQFEGPLRETN